MRREALRRGARGERLGAARAGRVVVRRQAAEPSSAAASASVTSTSRGSAVRGWVSTSIASRTSTALPAVRPSTWSMSVSSASQRRPAPARDRDDGARELGAAPRSGRKAPEPALTSITSPSSPAASFLERMEATISGIDSTVAVASRSA